MKEPMKEPMKYVYWGGGALVVSLLVTWIWYMTCVGFVDNYEYGFIYDKYSGSITKVEHTGWVVLNPFVSDLHKIDLRPYQISVNANNRVLNAKLVRFNPDGLEKFLELHGRSAGDKLEGDHGLLEILRSYAFDRQGGKNCPFLTVVNEMADPGTPEKVK